MFSTNKKMDDFVLIINSIKTLQVNDGENWNYIVDAFTTTTVHTDFNVDSVQMLCKNTETDKLFILDIGSVKDFKVFSDDGREKLKPLLKNFKELYN
jgi:hypothetical protein